MKIAISLSNTTQTGVLEYYTKKYPEHQFVLCSSSGDDIPQQYTGDTGSEIGAALQSMIRNNYAHWKNSVVIQHHLLDGREGYDVVVATDGIALPEIRPVETDEIWIIRHPKYHLLIAEDGGYICQPTTFIRLSLFWKLYSHFTYENAPIFSWLCEHFQPVQYRWYYWGSWIVMNRIAWRSV